MLWVVMRGVCVALVVPAVMLAQAVSGLPTGARIRISVQDGPLVGHDVGSLVGLSADSIMLAGPIAGTSRAYARVNVTRIEISERRYRRTRLGAGLGFVPGAALGAAVSRAADGSESGTTTSAVKFGLVFGTVGALLGGFIGAGVQTDVWRGVPDTQWHIGLRSVSAHGVAFAWRF